MKNFILFLLVMLAFVSCEVESDDSTARTTTTQKSDESGTLYIEVKPGTELEATTVPEDSTDGGKPIRVIVKCGDWNWPIDEWNGYGVGLDGQQYRLKGKMVINHKTGYWELKLTATKTSWYFDPC